MTSTCIIFLSYEGAYLVLVRVKILTVHLERPGSDTVAKAELFKHIPPLTLEALFSSLKI